MTIYLKKLDGSIEQFEDNMMQALNIDKEIQGESFGEIFTAESLSDEDKIRLGLMTNKELFIKNKSLKYEEISNAYSQEFINGYFHSEALGIDIDYRRNSTKNDLQNVDVLIEWMTDSEIAETEYKGYQDQKTIATLDQIKLMRKEMVGYSIYLYGKKEQLEIAIDEATTAEQLENIKW